MQVGSETLKKVASYVETAQSEIDNNNENRQTYIKRATQAAGVLANRGIISQDSVNSFVDKIASDETGTEVWNLVEKLASALQPEDFGNAEKIAAGPDLGPFEKLALFGDPRADVRKPGMID